MVLIMQKYVPDSIVNGDSIESMSSSSSSTLLHAISEGGPVWFSME